MNDNFPIIITERFVLRQFNNDDLENVYIGLSNPEVNKYYGVSFDSLEASKEQIGWFRDLKKARLVFGGPFAQKKTSPL